jgi:hypothetical protein
MSQGFDIRPVTESDRTLCEQWILANPEHRGKVKADFYLKPEDNVQTFVVTENDEPLFFFRDEIALRFHMEFGPSFTEAERDRNRRGLEWGIEWLLNMARGAGVRQLVTQSDSPELRKFCEKRLGFTTSSGEMFRWTSAPKPEEAQGKALQPLHQAT